MPAFTTNRPPARPRPRSRPVRLAFAAATGLLAALVLLALSMATPAHAAAPTPTRVPAPVVRALGAAIGLAGRSGLNRSAVHASGPGPSASHRRP